MYSFITANVTTPYICSFECRLKRENERGKERKKEEREVTSGLGLHLLELSVPLIYPPIPHHLSYIELFLTHTESLTVRCSLNLYPNNLILKIFFFIA